LLNRDRQTVALRVRAGYATMDSRPLFWIAIPVPTELLAPGAILAVFGQRLLTAPEAPHNLPEIGSYDNQQQADRGEDL
jgi:hypothetical protein